MSRRSLVFVAVALAALALGVANAAAASVSLVLPQGNAFAILGHSCGGIQEKVYATGFDPTSGYPVGSAYVSTRCGGSGRGGGYHVTTYSAWVSVTWDYTGAVVTDAAGGSAAVDPTLTVFDAYGNELVNQNGTATLVLAPGFVPAPRLIKIAPTAGPAAGGTTVTITGTGLTGATGVSFGGVAARSFTVASSTTITAVSPTAAAGTVDVTVSNAGGTSAAVSADLFTFVPAPTVTGIRPVRGPVTGGTTVTITGTGFSGATSVRFGSVATFFQVDSDTTITATSPAAEAAGAVDVTVTSLGGRSARSRVDRFTYLTPPPVVAEVYPASGPPEGGTQVTILGSWFSGATAVRFGGVAAAFTVGNAGTITATSPPGSGTVDVTVTTPRGTSTTDPVDEFTYAPAPVVDAVTPNEGPVGGGAFVVVTGSGFTGALEVDFGGTPVDFAVADDSTLYASSAAGDPGAVDVTVTTPSGTSPVGPGDVFTIVAAPTVTGIDPAGGPVGGGTAVTISGTGLADVTEVDFGGVRADFAANADGTITAVSPPGTAGTVDVTVTGPGGTSAAVPEDEFTYS